MIARTWRGWTTRDNADAYEYFLNRAVFPQLRATEGHHGVQLLRRDLADESEFVVINFFESMEAVKRFAGENYTEPVFEPEAKLLLLRIETEARHYEVRESGGEGAR
ncbi:MAG TPA: antibiotic biosynthesis monooxygenase [Terracidiphilus sp.]|nr:antibiotic biosynthesis monooxygenase [Terracidiphilus sp.]